MNRFWRIVLGVCGVLFLAAILFPVFQNPSANTGSRNTVSCVSNMKQLGLAVVQYEQDNDELMPRVAASDSNGWREAVYPFVKSTGVYRCPEDKRGSSEDAPEHLPKSYAANALCLSSGKQKITVAGLSMKTILAADIRGFDGEDWNMTDPAFGLSSGCELYTHKPSHYFYEHPAGRLNVLFADGHVKAMRPMDTLTPLNLWTPDNQPFTGADLANAQAALKNAENE